MEIHKIIRAAANTAPTRTRAPLKLRMPSAICSHLYRSQNGSALTHFRHAQTVQQFF
jgi:hypothetical protein